MKPVLYIIIPCYNESVVLPFTANLFLEKLIFFIQEERVSNLSRILFVDDGSKDDTWLLIKALARQNDHYIGIRNSRNRGHQNALLAGLMEAKDLCDITISVDCDGQDDMDAAEEMLNEYLNGCEIVYGVRRSRDHDTYCKAFSAQKYYKLLRWMGVDVIYNHADFRLVSARVLQELSNFHEVNLYLRGMFPLVGFKSTCVYYDRKKRIAGESHYPLKKMAALALDGITSLSIRPIRMITAFGVFVALLSFVGICWAILAYVTGHTVSGWASTVCIISFIGGIQLLSLGIIGEYIGKIYLETKRRPRYIIEQRTWEKIDD